MRAFPWWPGARRPAAGPDISSPAFKADPFPHYRRLRDEAPVSRVVLPNGLTLWLVTRYDDVATVLRDERFVKDLASIPGPPVAFPGPGVPSFFRPLTHHMLNADPPDHTRLRSLVQRAFTPALVEGMRPRVQAIADGLLDDLAGRRRVDLQREYALPVPTTVIAEMLGVPVADRHRFHRWSRAMLGSSASGWGLWKAAPAVWRFLRYIRRLVTARRADPRDDLAGALVRAEEAGDRLSGEELVAMIFLLLVAGHETTVNLIGNGVLALLEHPDEMGRLRADARLVPSAVEELLRFTSPVETATRRFAREDVVLSGVTIPRGALALPVLASANRDAKHFADPDRLDVGREPNRHLSFGLGPHYCLGAPLARLEGQIALATLLRRTSAVRPAVPPRSLRWRGGLVVRGLEALPVEIDWRG